MEFFFFFYWTQVKFVDADSPTYAKNKRCEFWLRGNSGGGLASPRHTLPRNTTCLYHLRGAGPAMPSPTPPRPLPKFPEQRPGTVWRKPAPKPAQPQFRVWLSVLKFHVGTTSTSNDDECGTTLLVWDGDMLPLTDCNDISWWEKSSSQSITLISSIQMRFSHLNGYEITSVAESRALWKASLPFWKPYLPTGRDVTWDFQIWFFDRKWRH